MRGYPKRIATGEDLYNCLAMVQAGEFPAADLSDTIAAIEERKFTTVPIVSLSEDRKTAVINACSDAAKGAKIDATTATTISAVKTDTGTVIETGMAKLAFSGLKAELAGKTLLATDVPQDTQPAEETPALTEVTLSRALPQGATVLKIATEVSPFERLGITEDGFNSIKGVLKNYE